MSHRSQHFSSNYLTPQKKTRKKPLKQVIQMEPVFDEPDDQLVVNEFNTNDIISYEEDPLDLSLKSKSIICTQSVTSNTSNTASIIHESENYFLREENKAMQLKLNHLALSFNYENLSQNNELLHSYTGLPSNDIFMALYNLLKNSEIHYHFRWTVESISKPDQLLITLMKLRHNFPHFDLATRFKCSSSTITNITITWINVLHNVLFLKCMSKIPSRQKNQTCLPNCFKPFSNCRIIIDCTEIYTSVSRQSMNVQRDTFSSYKHRNTWKILIGISPNGVVTFVSSLFPGSTSDKVITLKSGLLEQLVSGDLVLADKGFLIKDILPPGVSLNLPPFLDTPQFTPEQVLQTEVIAKARIHIERAIQRIKCFSILNFIPSTMLKNAEQIFKVIAALTNLQYPLIQEVQNKM